uniref:Ribonuclease H-like domain-containing protein n=1 Tax=Tanacetum cinerariifolium TaxID=118510 RepID=A0A6L2LMG6_TANCI|nr:ribonuclease H-like domain-containing protein [Tanacetum cinerariifolium]
MSANDKFGLGYGDYRFGSILSYENEFLQSVFMNKESDLENTPVNDRYVKGMHAVPPPITGNYSLLDLSVEPPTSMPEPVANELKVVCEPRVWTDAPIIKEYESDSDDDSVSNGQEDKDKPSFVSTDNVKHVNTSRESINETNKSNHCLKFEKKNSQGSTRKGLGYAFTQKTCFVCGSFSQFIRDCDFHEKRMAKQAALTASKDKATGPRKTKPVWNNVRRVNHANKLVPSTVLTKAGKFQVNAARQNFTSPATSTSAASKVNTDKPFVNDKRPKRIFLRLIHFPKGPFIKQQHKVLLFHTKKLILLEISHFVLLGEMGILLLRPQQDHPYKALKDKGIVDSGCSRHMTWNKAHLVEYQDFRGGSVAFGGSNGRITGKGKIKTGRLDFEDVYYVEELKHYNLFSVSQICDKKNKVLFTDTDCLVLSPDFKLPDENQVLKIPRQHNMYSFNLKNITPSRDLACLLAKASIDESNKWYRRLGHVNFKNLNKLVKGNPVRGLPSKIFENNHSCVACQKGKQHKAFCKAKSENKPNVAGKGHAWMFDLDYLTNSMNYEPVSLENQANKYVGPQKANHSAGTQVNVDQGVNSKEIDITDKHLVLPIWSTYSTNVKSSGDKIEKNTSFKTCEKPVSQVEQVFLEELEKLKRHEQEAHNAAESLRKEATQNIQQPSTSSTKWVFRNKKDERGIVVWKKVRLVAQGHTQEEGIDYEEFFTPVAKIKAIRLFLAYASFMGFMVYQMDVKSAFMYGTIEEEVYVCQPLGFEDPDHPDKVYKVVKALHGLHQAPRACPDQTVSDKDSSNPLMADNLPKIVWYSTHHVALMKSWLVQKQTTLGQTTTGKEISNPFMAGSLPKTMLLTFIHVNDVTRLQALVDKKKVVVTEATIRDALCLDDAEGDLSLHSTKYTSPALTQKVFANMKRVGKGFSGVDTPLFEGMIVAQEVGEGDPDEVHVKDVNAAGVIPEGAASVADDDGAGISMDLLQNLLDTCTTLTRRVEHLEHDKIAQALEITKIETSDDTVMDDVSKQGRMIADMDADVDVTLKDVAADVKDVQDAEMEENDEESEPAELQEVVEVVTIAKLITEVVTAASATITAATPQLTTAAVPILTAAPSAARRRKGVVIRDPKETATPSTIIHSEAKSKDKGKGILVEESKPLKKQAQIKHDEAYAREKNMMIYLRNVAGFKMYYFKGMTYDDIHLIFEKKFNSNVAFLVNTKEQIDEEESRALKRINEVPNDEDDVYTEATPLALKVSVVDYEIYNEHNKPYYKIKRADGSHQLYLSFLSMLRNFDREDLEALWRLVKERFAFTKPKNFFDDFLLTTLGVMFEKPDIQAQIWKNQRSLHGQAKVKSWKLLESCDMQIITFTTTQLILLVERKYPLTRFTLDQMLNNVRLEVEEESEVSLELLSFGVDAAEESQGKHAK